MTLRTNYVLIDFENVQPEAVAMLDHEHFKVIVFVGATQNKIPFEIANALQRIGSNAEYVKISGNGSNALDFHIALYIGQLAAADPTAFFHVISKDTGFDPLIKHLKDKKVLAARSRDVTDIPFFKMSNTRSLEDKLSVVLTKLQQLGTSKPRTVKTLSSTISSLFQKHLAEEEVTAIVAEVQTKGWAAVVNEKVTYALPPA
ncbi:PIN domain-containing protein [Variovorax paradoxus]|uniref:PIN domain-containing protein n=1 Tax=Variovorax paradoxus TaxID=34073 RepID=UPI0021ACA0DB|nr:PIN domain-containing protein [Variovorax paradoxus]UVH57193.1 PIN domain-containing protein [Variovorax paradoxus]